MTMRKTCATSNLHSEVDRLKGVYREYGERGWGRTKWAVTNRGNQAIRRERNRKLQRLLRSADFLPLGDRRVLDVGCGSGEALAGFEAWGARPENLWGVDLLHERVRRARENFPTLNFREANGEALPFDDEQFDLVLAFTVFTSILDSRMAQKVVREMARVLRSGGAVVWYDFRVSNPFNPHVKGLSHRDIRRLFPGFHISLIAVTLIPQLARRCGPLTNLFYPRLAALPFLRSHYLGLLIKP